MSDIFEKASRLKLTFFVQGGVLNVEDLWDLPLTSAKGASLDRIAVGLHREMEQANLSFVNPEKASDSRTKLRFDIVKHIIDVRMAEQAATVAANQRAQRRQKVMELIARKQDQAMDAMSIEELTKLLDEAA